MDVPQNIKIDIPDSSRLFASEKIINVDYKKPDDPTKYQNEVRDITAGLPIISM